MEWEQIYKNNKEYYDPIAELVKRVNPSVGLEIGFGDYGISARAYLENCNGSLISIDRQDWLGYRREWEQLFLGRLINLYGDSHFIEINEVFDYVYIDGDHTYEGCKLDLIKYSKLVKPSGVLLVDDFGVKGGMTNYNDSHDIVLGKYGVMKACEEILSNWTRVYADIKFANGARAFSLI